MQIPGDPFHRGVAAPPPAPSGASLGSSYGSFFGPQNAPPSPWAQVGAQVGGPPPSPWDASAGYMHPMGGLSRPTPQYAPPMAQAPAPQQAPTPQPPPMRQAPQLSLMGMYGGGQGRGPLGRQFMSTSNGADWHTSAGNPQNTSGWQSTGENSWTKG